MYEIVLRYVAVTEHHSMPTLKRKHSSGRLTVEVSEYAPPFRPDRQVKATAEAKEVPNLFRYTSDSRRPPLASVGGKPTNNIPLTKC